MKTASMWFIVAIPLVFFQFVVSPPCWGQRKSESLSRAREAVRRSGGVTPEMLNSESSFVEGFVNEFQAGKKNEFSELIKEKGLEREVDVVFASAWTELRLSERIPPGRKLTIKDLQDAIANSVKLKITSKPEKATVYLRDKSNLVGETEITRWVLPGSVRVVVRKDGFQEDDQTIEIEKGKNKEHPVELKPKN